MTFKQFAPFALLVSLLVCGNELSGEDSSGPDEGASIAKAKLYQRHGLGAEAKREAIEVLCESEKPDQEVAEAKFLLAGIAAREGRESDALELWSDIIKNHPKSHLAGQSRTLSDLARKSAANHVESGVGSAIADSYIRRAKFWIPWLDDTAPIDTSWIPEMDVGVKWLDRVLVECPKAKEAETASVLKVMAFLGRENGYGAWGQVAGALRDFKPATKRFKDFMSKAEEALNSHLSRFPNSQSSQRLMFVCAQIYWNLDDREKAEVWLRRIIKINPDVENDFWSEMATLRLKHWKS